MAGKGGANPNSGPPKGAKYRTKEQIAMDDALREARALDRAIKRNAKAKEPKVTSTPPALPPAATTLPDAPSAPGRWSVLDVAPVVSTPPPVPPVAHAPPAVPAPGGPVDAAYALWLARPIFKPGTSPLEFLQEVMHCDQAPLDLRVRCAQIAAPLIHAKPAEVGKKAAKDEAAKKSSGAGGKFAPTAAPMLRRAA